MIYRRNLRLLLVTFLLLAISLNGTMRDATARAEDRPRQSTETSASLKGADATIGGSWHVVEMSLDGQQVPFDRRIVYRFRKGKLNIGIPGRKSAPLAYKLENSNLPFRIDLIFGSGRTQQKSKAIYAIDGKRLVVCYPSPGQQRPTKLITQKGDRRTLIIFERVAAQSNRLSDLIGTTHESEK